MRFSLTAMFVLAAALPRRRDPARIFHRRARPGHAAAAGRAAAAAGGARRGSRSCRSPRAAAPTTACCCSSSSRSPAWLAAYVIHRWASHAMRRSAAWDCGFPDASPATQYTAGSFAQPIRRVFGELRVPRPRGSPHAAAGRHAARPLPRASARPGVGCAVCARRAASWASPPTASTGCSPGPSARYLTLVFGAFVVLLMILAVWQ